MLAKVLQFLLFCGVFGSVEALRARSDAFNAFITFNKVASNLYLVIDDYQSFPQESSFKVVPSGNTEIEFTDKAVIFQLFKKLGWNGESFVYSHDRLGRCEISMRDGRISFENIEAMVDDILFPMKEHLRKKALCPADIEQIPKSFLMTFKIDSPLRGVSDH